ncbi:heme peroxidase, partial [Mycena epipterygia]
ISTHSVVFFFLQGRCTDPARAAIRLAFHDAAAGQPNGGADGSMLTDPNEVLRTENNGLQTIVGLLSPLPAQFGVPAGDVLHVSDILPFRHLACPGGPQVRAWVGREAAFNIAPQGLLPSPESPVADLVALFADKGFNAQELMALIGAHTTGKQRFVEPAIANASFDSTVTIWDTRFLRSPSCAGTYRLDSDVNFALDPTTSADFTRFIGPPGAAMLTDYAAAHEKMSLLGVDTTGLTDCSEILP